MTIYIYGLQCPLSGETRYIGKSINPRKRFIAHIGGALRNEYQHHTARWIRTLDARGLRPALLILQAVQTGQDWRAVEREWIQRATQAGWPITNSTAGGEGLDYICPEAKAKYLKNLGAAVRRRMQTPAGLKNLEKMRIACSTPEARANRIASLKEAWTDEAKKAAWDAAMERMRVDPEAQQKRSHGIKAHWAANRDDMIKKIWTPETRAKQSSGRAASWADPETRERMMNRWTPEARAKQALEVLSRQAKIQAAMTPEVRAKQAAKLKETWARRKAALSESS